MNKLTAAIGTLIAVALLAAACGGGGDSGTRTTPDIHRAAFQANVDSPYLAVVARVNGVEISGDLIQFRVRMEEEAAAFAEDPPVDLTDPRQILANELRLEIWYQEAERSGVVCTDVEVSEIAQQQIGVFTEDAPVIVETWASLLSVDVNTLTTDGRVLEDYARKCAQAALRSSLSTTGNVFALIDQRAWTEFGEALLAEADVEILDPQLQ